MGFRVQMMGDWTLKEEIDGVILDWKVFKEEFINTGRNIHKFIIEYLKTNSQGTSNASGIHLHNEIDFNFRNEPFRVVVEIGDIAKLNSNAPWWKIQNYGGAHPMAGRFLPGGFVGKKWIYDPGSNRGKMISENARIKAINYIENTEHYGTSMYQKLIQISTT